MFAFAGFESDKLVIIAHIVVLVVVLKDCQKLQQVDLPSGITSIGNSSFSGMTIKSLTIPEGVTSIAMCEMVRCGSKYCVMVIPAGSSRWHCT